MIVVDMMSRARLPAVVPDLARLRIAVFRDWPYLYDGSEDYERTYLQTYVTAPGAAVAVARDGDAVIGASTCVPMRLAPPEVRAPFTAAGLNPADWLHFGESVLLPEYRGQGLGKRFFELREAHAMALGLAHTTFCAVQRPHDHPLRPHGAQDLEEFWMRRGYTKQPALVCHMTWQDSGETTPTAKPLMFWTRAL